MFERAPDVDGIFVASDLMALGAIGVIERLGKRPRRRGDRRVPGANIELASMAEPSLTTIRQRTENRGRLMADAAAQARPRGAGRAPGCR